MQRTKKKIRTIRPVSFDRCSIFKVQASKPENYYICTVVYHPASARHAWIWPHLWMMSQTIAVLLQHFGIVNNLDDVNLTVVRKRMREHVCLYLFAGLAVAVSWSSTGPRVACTRRNWSRVVGAATCLANRARAWWYRRRPSAASSWSAFCIDHGFMHGRTANLGFGRAVHACSGTRRVHIHCTQWSLTIDYRRWGRHAAAAVPVPEHAGQLADGPRRRPRAEAGMPMLAVTSNLDERACELWRLGSRKAKITLSYNLQVVDKFLCSILKAEIYNQGVASS